MGGWGELYPICWIIGIFFNFAKPLRESRVPLFKPQATLYQVHVYVRFMHIASVTVTATCGHTLSVFWLNFSVEQYVYYGEKNGNGKREWNN